MQSCNSQNSATVLVHLHMTNKEILNLEQDCQTQSQKGQKNKNRTTSRANQGGNV